MLTSESHVATAIYSVEHKERRKATVEIHHTTTNNNTHTNTCLSDYDVISSLQMVYVFLLVFL